MDLVRFIEEILNGKPHFCAVRTSHDTEIKLEPVTKHDKRNTAKSKKLENDVM